jgi:hypothetical protein
MVACTNYHENQTKEHDNEKIEDQEDSQFINDID